MKLFKLFIISNQIDNLHLLKSSDEPLRTVCTKVNVKPFLALRFVDFFFGHLQGKAQLSSFFGSKNCELKLKCDVKLVACEHFLLLLLTFRLRQNKKWVKTPVSRKESMNDSAKVTQWHGNNDCECDVVLLPNPSPWANYKTGAALAVVKVLTTSL